MDTIKIDPVGKYVLVSKKPLSDKEKAELEDRLRKFWYDHEEHFVVLQGVTLERILPE